MSSTAAFVATVEQLVGAAVSATRGVGGGCISETRRVELADGRVVFAKSGAGLPAGLHEREAEGLRWLRDADAVRVPEVLALGPDPDGNQVLVLEWIDAGSPGPTTAAQLGTGLARLHAAGADGFGAPRDGFIGSLPQRNTPVMPVGPAGAPDAWPTFWFTRRIEPLARRALDGGSLPARTADRVERLGARLPDLAGPPEPPARVHGDLWTGNVVVDRAGAPWVVDPAAYGGHREVDLAMLHLFGDPGPAFVAAYEDVAPLAAGWRDRLRLWQLEPLLVHTILFGGSYAAQTESILRDFS